MQKKQRQTEGLPSSKANLRWQCWTQRALEKGWREGVIQGSKGAHWSREGIPRKATSCCLCPLLPPPRSPPFRPSSWQFALVLLPPHQVNLLLPSKQTMARNAVRLSLFVVAPYLGSYLFSQIPHYGSPALHGVKEKAILFLNPIKLSGSYSLFTKADPLLTVHRPRGRLAKRRSESLQSGWCLDLGGTVFFSGFYEELALAQNIIKVYQWILFPPFEGTFQPLSLENSQRQTDCKWNEERF